MARRSNRSRFSHLTDPKEQDFIETARARFKQATDADSKQRVRELEDLQFYAGDQWPQEVKNSREGTPGNAQSAQPPLPPRPSLTVANVREPVRQVLNSEKESELGVSIVASDDFGQGTSVVTKAEIELREGLIRRIQRESQATNARSWAFSRATIAGRGYYAVRTRYAPGKTFDQEVYVERIWNQNSVTLDPAHQQPDGSDVEFAFIIEDMPWDRYRAEYGTVDDEKNALMSLSESEWSQLGNEIPDWFKTTGETRMVRVAEYWYLERESREIVQLASGEIIYADEWDTKADGPMPVAQDEHGARRRQEIQKRIKFAKIDGVKALEKNDWPGKYIPIVKVVGEELHPYDNQRRDEGMVRPGMDGCRAVNVLASKMVERIGYSSMTPWSMAEGQDEGFQNEYLLAATRTVPVLHYKQTDINERPAPPPVRLDTQGPDIQPMVVGTQMFQAFVRSSLGVPDITNLDPKINSDRQLKRVLTQSEQATSHFLSNLAASIRYEGIIENDLLYPVYGLRKGRIVRMMNAAGDAQAVPVGQHFVPHPETQHPMLQMPPQQGMPAQPVGPGTPGAQMYQLSPEMTADITVKVTKDYDTRREEQESTLATLVENDPQQIAVVGDLLFKYSDGPGHEELQERYEAMLAPPVQALLKGQQGPDPQVQQLQQQVQQLTQMLQTKTAEIQAKGQIDMQKTQLQELAEDQRAEQANQTAIERANIAAVASMSNAQMKVDAENFRSYVDAVETRLAKQEQLHLEHFGKLHEAIQQIAGHAHDVGMAHLEHQHALEQGQQAAALAPEPAANNGASGE